MPIPSTIESLSTTAASNGPAGSEQRTLADDGLRQAYAFIRQMVTLGSNIASASSITPPSTGSSFNITGTTTITGIASTNSWDGRVVTLIFAGALTLTHSSNLALPGSANITTAANDVAQFIQTASGAWRLMTYRPAAGAVGPFLPLVGGTLTGALLGTDATFSGAFVANGAVTLGDAIGDTVTIGGAVHKAATGVWTFPVPSSGILMNWTGVGGNDLLAGTAAGAINIRLTNSSNSITLINGVDTTSGFFGTTTAHPVNFYSNNIVSYTISSAGNHTFARGALTVTGSTATLGYGTGSGGTVTQITSKATAVTLNKACGEIVMHNASLGANTEVNFTLTNSTIATDDAIIVHTDTGATVGAYLVQCVEVGAGSAQISVRNLTAGALGEALNLTFAVIKAVTA